jgi:hypothetical protein
MRDGRVFKVVVLPDVKPRRASANRVGGGKSYARSVKLATITQPLRVCPSCKRQRPINSFLKKGKDGPYYGDCYACRTTITAPDGKRPSRSLSFSSASRRRRRTRSVNAQDAGVIERRLGSVAGRYSDAVDTYDSIQLRRR